MNGLEVGDEDKQVAAPGVLVRLTLDGVEVDFQPVEVELARTKGPDRDRWAKGTGASYDVRLAGGLLIGRVHSTRLSSPAPRGSRLRTGEQYTAWGEQAVPDRDPDGHYYRGNWYDTRKRAVGALVQTWRRRQAEAAELAGKAKRRP